MIACKVYGVRVFQEFCNILVLKLIVPDFSSFAKKQCQCSQYFYPAVHFFQYPVSV